MGRAKAGRKRRPGSRHPGGQLVRRDPGNDRVVARRLRFAVFADTAKQPHQADDAIGRAWAAGLLDGTRVDPVVLRDAGRRYAALYWRHWPTNSGIAQYGEMVASGSISGPHSAESRLEAIFARLDAALRSAGLKSALACRRLCVDPYHFPDDDPAWLGRLIVDAAGRRSRTATDADRAMLELAIEGLLAMVG